MVLYKRTYELYTGMHVIITSSEITSDSVAQNVFYYDSRIVCGCNPIKYFYNIIYADDNARNIIFELSVGPFAGEPLATPKTISREKIIHYRR